jgi:hypothetical protein
MALGKRLISTGVADAACLTETTDIFGDSSGVALYSLDYDASTAPDGTDYSGSPTNVEFGVGGKINYGARFNGSSSVILVEDSSANAFGFANHTGTASAWVNINSFSAENNILAKRDSGNPGNRHWMLLVDTSKNIKFYIYNTDSNQQTVTSSTVLNANQWYHIAVTLTTSDVKIYINGVEDTTASSTYSTIQNDGADLQIGRRGKNTGHNYFNGSIDQVRIFSKALSSDEVATLYAETACVYECTTDTVNYPSGTTPVAYYKLDNSAEDETGSYDGTESNIEYRFGRFGQAAVFNGSSSYIDTGFSLYNKSVICLSTWINVDDLSSIQMFFGSTCSSGCSFGGQVNTNGTIRFRITDGTEHNATTSNTISAGQWYHVVCVWDKTIDSGELKIYIDGTEASYSTQQSQTNNTTENVSLRLGRAASTYFDGSIDQVRIYSTALTSSQVTELYEEKPCADTSNFKTVLYEGTGSTQYISNVGMDLETDGGLVWIKNRNYSQSNRLYDSVRGANLQLSSNQTGDEANSGGLTSFDSNGFSLDNWASVNTNNYDYVAWCWKAGGDAVSNSSGMGSQISTNDKGFSIVKYTGSGSSGTVAHGLTVDGTATKPELAIFKATNASKDWFILTDVIDGSADYLSFTTADKTDLASGWLPDTTNFNFPTSSGLINDSSGTQEMIVYCFASVDGYSKIGTYEGLGTSTVTVSGLGFKPSWIIVKNADDTANWNIYDSRRSGNDSGWDVMDTMNDILYPNLNIAEVEGGSTHVFTANSDGFVVGASNHLQNNKAGDTFIYMAFK